MASPKRAPRPQPRPAPPRRPPSYPRRPLPREPGRRPAPARPRPPSPGRPRPGPSPFPYPQRPKIPAPYKPKPLPKFKPLPTPKFRPPPGWQRYRKFIRGPHQFIIDQFVPTDPFAWSPGKTPNWLVPPGWFIDCGPVGQADYGYGTGYARYSSCPGGVCAVSYSQVVHGGMTPSGVPLTVGSQKLSVYIGAKNYLASINDPAGRMTRHMKICRSNNNPSPNPQWANPRFPPLPLPEAPPMPEPDLLPPPRVPRPRPYKKPKPQPQPWPSPLPYKPGNPYPVPVLPPFPGPLPLPLPVPGPGPIPVPGPVPGPRPQPGPHPRPWPNPEPEPEPAPHPQPKPEPHVPNPPGGTKRKIPYGGIEHWIYDLYKKSGNIYGGLTELKDMLDCFEKNVKDKHYKRGGLLHERVARAALYLEANPLQVKWGSFLACMAEENAKDYLIGKMNELARQIVKNPYYVRPVGPGTGGWMSRHNTSIKMKDI